MTFASIPDIIVKKLNNLRGLSKMDLQLKGKKALVCAATSGLGFATALELAREGAHIFICGREEQKLMQAIKIIKESIAEPSHVFGMVADVIHSDQIDELITQVADKLSGIDILITNAAGPSPGHFDNLDTKDWQQACNLTLLSCSQLIKKALPYLRQSKNASILTITSISTKQPIPGLTLSNVFRPGVIGLTKTLSQELGPENLRVNSILPGWTMTDHSKQLLNILAEKNHSSFKEEYEKISQATALKRIGQPEEFAKVATFLVSPAASYLTGVMLQVDGGSYQGLF